LAADGGFTGAADQRGRNLAKALRRCNMAATRLGPESGATGRGTVIVRCPSPGALPWLRLGFNNSGLAPAKRGFRRLPPAIRPEQNR
jgi:hypothetical protein